MRDRLSRLAEGEVPHQVTVAILTNLISLIQMSVKLIISLCSTILIVAMPRKNARNFYLKHMKTQMVNHTVAWPLLHEISLGMFSLYG